MEDAFSFPAADLYQSTYEPAPPGNLPKSILSLPTEVFVDIARLNYKTAVALMRTNHVLHAAGVTALYARVFLMGTRSTIQILDAPNLLVPGVLGGLLASGNTLLPYAISRLPLCFTIQNIGPRL